MIPGMFDVNTPQDMKKEVFQEEITFLASTKGNTEAFVQKYGKNDSYVYKHEVRVYESSERIVKKRQISAREYIEMLDQAAPGFIKLQLFRQMFIYEHQNLVVDTYVNVDHQVSLLRIETSKQQSELRIPSFLKILREVTEDNNYASSSIARKGWKMNVEDKKQIMKSAGMVQKEQPANN